MARIGLLGGTFNPPHLGHMLCAQWALEGLGLDRVLLLPVNTPPHKEIREEPGANHRVELCRRAVAGVEGLEVSTLEVERPGPSFTIDTLRALHERADPGDELTFIVGADQACGLPGWRDPEGILELAELGVADRAGMREADVIERLAGLPGAAERVRFFPMPRVDVSSSLIRSRAAEGRSVRWLVPDAVASYIAEHGLYGAGREAVAR
jgi:nicotinate-nucleotide adenylyltransferase